MLELPLNDATIILGCIFSMILSARRLRSIPTPPMTALTEFFHADAEIKVHLLPEYQDILFLFHYDRICVFVCIQCYR